MAIATERQADVSVTIGGREITFETGKLAKQADGAVVVRSGETMVLATAQGRMEPREGADFFPLTVDVEERMYAAGKIPGGFFKREGRPTERAILTARMIDRPIRPLWPKGYKNETQVICTVLSADLMTAHDILCINGASAALMISPMPFLGPVGAVRISIIDGELVVNPTLPEVEEHTELDLIVVGTTEALTMVEAGANEVSEDRLLEALDLAHSEIRKICEAQLELQRQAGKAKWLDPSVTEEIEREFGDRIRERIQAEGLRAADVLIEEALGELSMDSTEEDVLRQLQRKMSIAVVLEQIRLELVLQPVREQFESDLRALTDAEQDSKELKSAKRQLLFDHIVETVACPSRSVRPSARARQRRRRTRSRRTTSRRPRRRSTRSSSAARSRSRSTARTAGRRRKFARSRARSVSRRACTARGSSRAGRRRSCRCSRSARPRMVSGSTTCRSRPIAATCTITTSRPTRSARPA